MKIQLRKGELNKFWFTAVAVVFSLCLFVVLSYTGYTGTINNVIAVASVVISVYLCYVYRFNIGMLIVMLMILYTNYSVVVGVYLDPNIRPAHLYAQFKNMETYGIGIMCILIFELVLLLSSHMIKNVKIIDIKEKVAVEYIENNSLISFGAIIAYCLMFFSGFDFGLGEDGRALITAISEYKIIIQIIGLYYSHGKKGYVYIWTILVFITSVLTFMGGNRVDAMSNIIALVVMGYYNFIDYKKLMLVLPFGLVLLAGVGYMRTDFSLSFEAIEETMNILSRDKLTYEGAIFGYLPSLSVVEITDQISVEEKLDVFAEHLKDVFFVFSTDPNKTKLEVYSREYFLHYWGFVSPPYFYFWIGYFGPVICALLVSLYIKFYVDVIKLPQLKNYKSKLKYVLSIYFIANVARWYCYGPMYLIRNMFICIIAFTVVYLFDNLIRRRTELKYDKM